MPDRAPPPRFNPMRFRGRDGLATVEEMSRLQDLIVRGQALDQTWVQQYVTQQATNVSVTGGGFDPFDGYAVMWASPDGDNDNDGTMERPKRTGAAAFLSLDADGGTMMVASNTPWSDGTEGYGLAAGQGMRLSQQHSHGEITGWLHAKPLTVQGWGFDEAGQFGENYTYLQWGLKSQTLNCPRTDPGIWLAYSGQPITFRNIYMDANLPARVGMDYRRRVDQAGKPIAWANVTGASRASGLTTFTVACPQALTVSSMSRDGSGDVTVNFDPNSGANIFAYDGMYITITGSDPDFPSGDYPVVESIASGTLKFHDGGSSHALKTVTGVTMYSANCFFRGSAGLTDFIELQSTNSEFPTTMYEITNVAVSSGVYSITVLDPYGGSGGRSNTVSASDIGQWVTQIRFGANAGLDVWDSCHLSNPGPAIGGQAFMCGPTLDRGTGVGGNWSWIFNGQMNGVTSLVSGAQGCSDINRRASHFASGGSTGGTGFIQIGTRTQSGQIRVYGSQQGAQYITIKEILQDNGIFSLQLDPAVELLGQSYIGTIENISHHDDAVSDQSDAIALKLSQYTTASQLTVINTRTTGGQRNITDGNSVLVTINEGYSWHGQTVSLERQRRIGNWGNDGRLAGRRIDAQSQFGVIQAMGLTNCLTSKDPNTWTRLDGGTVTVTAAQATDMLLGQSSAYKLDGTSCRMQAGLTTGAMAAGDHFVFGAWMKSLDGKKLVNGGILWGLTNGSSSYQLNYTGFGGDGEWQWVAGIYEIDATFAAGTASLLLYVANTYPYLLYKPTVLHLPIASVSGNDAYRLYHTFRPFPDGITKGVATTMEGVPLVGRGGIGSETLTVGGASGQITVGAALTRAVQIVDPDTGAVIGVVVPNAYTVNP